MSAHIEAWCRTCKWAASGPDAEVEGKRHQLASLLAPVQHPVTIRRHPRHLCSAECHTKGKP